MVSRDNLFTEYFEFIFIATQLLPVLPFFMETGPIEWQALIQITSQFDLKHKSYTEPE